MGRRLGIRSMATTKKKQRVQTDRRLFKEKISTVIIGLLVVATLFAFAQVIWQKSTQPVSTDYDGTIADRWADYSNSQEGSRPFFRLLIESDDHKRFTVKVDPNVYESARVGMRIKSRSGQVVLIDSDRNSPSNK